MADIIDPVVIRFCNEQLRPLAETLRDGKVFGAEVRAVWDDQISALLAANADSDPIEDGRDAEGVSRLTKADIVAFMAVVTAMAASLDAPGTMTVIRKPTVRSVR